MHSSPLKLAILFSNLIISTLDSNIISIVYSYLSAFLQIFLKRLFMALFLEAFGTEYKMRKEPGLSSKKERAQVH